MLVYVSFSDSSDTVIDTYIGGPQDPVSWPNQGTVDTSDPRWATSYDSLGSWIQSQLPPPD
jgi:hypothetical protein